MNKLILITRDTSNGISKIWRGLANDPDNLVVAHQTPNTLLRCMIDPANESKVYAVGTNGSFYAGFRSADGGQTFTTSAGISAIGSGDLIRQLKVAGNKVIMMTSTKLIVSTDSGANYAESTPSLAGGRFVDMHFSDANTGAMIKSFVSGASGCNLYRTIDNAATWTLGIDMSTLPGWSLNESGRRVFCTQGNDFVMVLTTHKLWLLEWDGSAYTGAILWDHIVQTQSTFPWLNLTTTSGYQGSADLYKGFDDLFVDIVSGRIWLGGTCRLRAHSFDQSVFQFSNPGELNAFPTVAAIYSHGHWFRNASDGVVTGTDETPPVFPLTPCIYKTSTGGTSVQEVVFPTKHNAQHAWGVFTESVPGCTLSDACNYDGSADVDNGSCQVAVRLVDCADITNVLVTSQPDIHGLACRTPRFAFVVQALDPLQQFVNLSLQADGQLVFTYGTNISLSLTTQERLELFLGGLIYAINSTTTFRAYRIPAAQNLLLPGSPYGVWIEAPDSTFANVTGSMFSAAINGLLNSGTFDAGSNGSIVRVAEWPGRCFRVCGAGDCAQAQNYTLQSVHPDCSSCVPTAVPTICTDCSRMVSANGMFLTPSTQDMDIQCLSAGQYLDFALNINFVPRQPQAFTPIESGATCVAGNVLSRTIPGNRTTDFPVGTQFSVQPSGHIYTVSTVVYDQGNDTTSIVSVEVCQGGAAIDTMTSFYQCPTAVTVVIRDVNNNATLLQSNYSPLNNIVDVQFSWQVPDYGRYEVIIQAQDCVETRTCRYFFSACETYTVTEIGCHSFRIGLNRPAQAPGTGQNVTITIKDLNTNTVVYGPSVVTDQLFPVTFAPVDAGDTVYLVTIVGTDRTIHQQEIIDTCDVRTCRQELIRSTLCDTDPCGKDCKDAEDRAARRQELQRLHFLLTELEAEVLTYRNRWSGLPDYPVERLDHLAGIAPLLNTMRMITKRCGKCGTATLTNTGTCGSCNPV